MCSLIAKVLAKFSVERVSKEDINTLNICPPSLTLSVIIGIWKTQFAETASIGSEGQRKFKQEQNSI